MTPQQEQAFQQWYSGWAQQMGLNPNPDDPRHFYDYRAAFLSGAQPDRSGHWPSQFKREGHPNLIVGGVDTRTGQPANPLGASAAPPAPANPVEAQTQYAYTDAQGVSLIDPSGTQHFVSPAEAQDKVNQGWQPETREAFEQRRYAEQMDDPAMAFVGGAVEGLMGPLLPLAQLPTGRFGPTMDLQRHYQLLEANPMAATGGRIAGMIGGAFVPGTPMHVAGLGGRAAGMEIAKKVAGRLTSEAAKKVATKAIPLALQAGAEGATIGTASVMNQQLAAGQELDPATIAKGAAVGAAVSGALSLVGLGLFHGASRVRSRWRSKLDIEGNPMPGFRKELEGVQKELTELYSEQASVEKSINDLLAKQYRAKQAGADLEKVRGAIATQRAKLAASDRMEKELLKQIKEMGDDVLVGDSALVKQLQRLRAWKQNGSDARQLAGLQAKEKELLAASRVPKVEGKLQRLAKQEQALAGKEGRLSSREEHLKEIVDDLANVGKDEPGRLRWLGKQRKRLQSMLKPLEQADDELSKELAAGYRAELKIVEENLKQGQTTIFMAQAQRLAPVAAVLRLARGVDNALFGRSVLYSLMQGTGNTVAGGLARAASAGAPALGRITQVESVRLLAQSEIDELQDRTEFLDPMEVAQQAQAGYVAGGLDPASAGELAGWQARRVALAKEVLARGNRLEVSGVLNALEDPRRVYERLRQWKATKEDVLVLARVHPELHQKLVSWAKDELKTNRHLTAQQRAQLMLLADPRGRARQVKTMLQLGAAEEEPEHPRQRPMGPQRQSSMFLTESQRIQREAQKM